MLVVTKELSGGPVPGASLSYSLAGMAIWYDFSSNTMTDLLRRYYARYGPDLAVFIVSTDGSTLQHGKQTLLLHFLEPLHPEITIMSL